MERTPYVIFLTTGGALGLDLRFDETKLEAAWNYLNKIWNITRYVLMNLGENYTCTAIEPEKLKYSLKIHFDAFKSYDSYGRL